MLNFLINGVLASIIGSLILLFMGGIFSRYARWLLTSILGRLLDVDIEYVFRSKDEAYKDIKIELRRSSFIYLFMGRGNDIQNNNFIEVLQHQTHGKLPEYKIMLPSPIESTSSDDWIKQRENELAAFDPPFCGPGVLRHQIKTTIQYLQNFINKEEIELKLYNYPHIGRIVITDRFVYFTPYSARKHGRDSPIIKYRRGGEFYEFFWRLFFQLWEVSQPVESNNSLN
jgi:hypothetical protein